MPPKRKFTKEDIVNAALLIVRREGMERVTARSLGNELGSSSRPIFTLFQSMDEVQQGVFQAARNLYNDYIKKGLKTNPAFKGVGMEYIRFAKEEPKLFSLLFMTARDTPFSFSGILSVLDDNSHTILNSIQEEYGLSEKASGRVYECLWVVTHGIACLCATGTSNITEEESSKILTEVFTGLLIKIKSQKEGEEYV